MLVRMVYVACDRCGVPASQPVDGHNAARRAVPRDWLRLIESATGRRVDWCPACCSGLRRTVPA